MREHIARIIAMSSLLACAPASSDAVEGSAARVVPHTPSDPAFVGEAGTGLGDTPLQRPDRVAILTLARSRDFTELDRWMTYFQERFESDQRKEQWAIDAFDAFAVTDPALGDVLDAWVAAAPESFAAFAARGSWANAMGWAARGEKFVAETSGVQLAAMAQHHTRAVADLQRALELRPRAISAHVDLIAIAKSTLDDPDLARRNLDAALAICPGCFTVRSAYLYGLEPRWGGSYAQMDAFTTALAPTIEAHPRLALLRGYAAMDRCSDKELSLSQRRAHCDEALRHGDHPQMLLTRARLARDAKRDDDARADLDRALRLDPQFRDALVARFYLRRTDDPLGAGEDLALAFQLDSADPDIEEGVKWMVAKLRYEGDVRSKAGKHDEAVPYLELAATLAPGDKDLRRRQAWNAGQLGPEELASRVAARPTDFELRLLLDHALAKSKRFAEVVKSWDEYLARVPDDGRAHRERGGAKWHLRQHEAAIEDTQRACDLGETQACADLPKMRARLGN